MARQIRRCNTPSTFGGAVVLLPHRFFTSAISAPQEHSVGKMTIWRHVLDPDLSFSGKKPNPSSQLWKGRQAQVNRIDHRQSDYMAWESKRRICRFVKGELGGSGRDFASGNDLVGFRAGDCYLSTASAGLRLVSARRRNGQGIQLRQ